MRRRWLVLVVSLSLAALGTGTGWIYTHPPLMSAGFHERHDGDGKTLVYGIELDNTGRFPLTLTAVTINGDVIDYPQAMAVSNFTDAQLAANAAIMMEEDGHKLTTGPVNGWEMQPVQRVGRGRYGLRLDWEGMPTGTVEIVVHYRYLGLPMKYSVTSRWPIG